MKRTGQGCIYLIRSKKYNAVKIGISIYPGIRVTDIGREIGDRKASLERVIFVSNMLLVEQYFHNLFKSKHIKDEWFNLSPVDIFTFDQHALKVKDKYSPGEY